MATPVLCCGFECGGAISNGHHLNSTLGTAPTFNTTTFRSGLRSLRCNAAGGTSGVRIVTGSSLRQVGRFYIQFVTLPGVDCYIAHIDSSVGGPAIRFKQSDSSIYASVDTTLGASGVPITTGVWYRIDYNWLIVNAANDISDVQVNGVACGQATAAGLNSGSTVCTYGILTSTTAELFLDDLLVSATAADYPLGAGYVKSYIPTADGTHNVAGGNDFERSATGTDITNATTTAFQLVDDRPLKSGVLTEYINLIAPPNATDYVELDFESSVESAAPRAVEAIMAYASASVATNNLRFALRDNNGATQADVFNANSGGGTSAFYARAHFATIPGGGGAAWTLTAFNSLRARLYTSDAAPDPWVGSLMIEAEYADTGTPVSVTGVVAASDAAALAGTITAVRTTSIAGALADAPAAGLSGTVQIARSVTGELATADAAALAGTVQVARSVSGEAAVATADGQSATITSVRIASIVGEAASATSDGLAGTATAVRIVSISGEIAAASSAGLEADVYQSFTLNLAIAHTNDDGWAADNGVGTGFLPTDALINVGQHSGQSGAVQIWGRFTSVSGLLDAQILSAVYNPKYKTKVGGPLTNVHLELAESPAQPTSASNLSGRTLTTALTAVDNPTFSDGDRMGIDVTDQLQEIIDAGHDPTAIQVIWIDDGSAAGFNLIQIYDYSSSPSDAAQLDITYIPAQTNANISGELAEATAAALEGTVTSVRIASISGELSQATSAALDGVITAVRIVSISGETASATADGLAGAVQVARSVAGELATATADALEGVITAQSETNASITGEVADATAEALQGTATAVRIVTISGEVAAADADSLAATVTAVRITSVTGEIATATADSLSGSIQVARSVSGEIAQADADALPGAIQVSTTINMQPATATAEGQNGTVTAVRIVSVSGEVATATADALDAIVTAANTISISGETSQATANALEGTVTTVRSISIAGEPATADAVALEGVITTLPSANIDGAVASADATALEAVITTVQIASISGEPASADADVLEGVISAVQITSLVGQPAEASAAAESGVITSVRIVLIAGEAAVVTADVLEGTISTGAATNITISGEPATADSAAISATVSVVRIVNVSGELSTASAEALAGTIVIVPVVSVSISAEPSLATADALSGIITIEAAGEVEPIVSGLVELEDLIDRQIWPDNVDPSGAIFPKSEPVPSGYIEPIEETNPSGFQKQSGRTELWNL